MERFMFGALGPLEVTLIVFFAVLPMIILYKVATGRGLTPAYALWGLLGWLGLIIGLVVMPRRAKGGF